MATKRMPAVPDQKGQGSMPRVIICIGDSARRSTIGDVVASVLVENAQITGAATGAAAATTMKLTEFDCLVVDHALPDMQAADLLETITAHRDAPYVPTIVLAHDLGRDDLERLIAASVFQICPISTLELASLKTATRGAIEAKRQRAQVEAQARKIARQREQLQNSQQLDPLTGLQSSQAFYELLEVELRRHARNAQPMSLLIADIDCFTAFNYSYGQEAGDRCLKNVAVAIDQSFQRASDRVARIAGASFAVLLADTDSEDTALQAERLRECVWNLKLGCTSSSVADRITLSVGVATLRENYDKGWEYLLQTAQTALFHAKQQGRNWVEVANGF